MAEARVKWVDGLRFVGYSGSKHGILMDAGEKVGGTDTGARPGEIILIALGGCTGIDVASILNKMRVPFHDIEIVVKGESAPEHPKYWTHIQVKYIVKGKNLPEDKVKKAVELSQERYCSVGESLRRNVVVEHTYEVQSG
ncbi:MAG: OsmC family protein [Gemmatimonadota bacterium]|nr:MAG: OsmC family protein [Gemmatimonadota bacterium]